MWRTGARVNEALHIEFSDLDPGAGGILIRHGKGARGSGPRERTVGMDAWGWRQLEPWLDERRALPGAALFPVLGGASAGTRWTSTHVRAQLRAIAARTGSGYRLHPHGFRHTHAVELWREGVDIFLISRQLGHANVGVTHQYLRSIGADEVIRAIGARPQPTMPVPDFTTLDAPVAWFNHERLHEALGDIPPAEFEADAAATQRA